MLSGRRLLRLTRLDREEGQVLPMFAAGALAMILMTGIVVDGGNLFQNKQSLQNAADASAIAAALYIADPTKPCVAGAPDPIGACAGTYAGYNAAGDGTALGACPGTVTETKPPPTPPGCYVYPYTPPGASSNDYIEVWLTRTTSNFFGGLLGIKTSTESARAVGTLTGGSPPPITFAALDNSCDAHTLLVKLGGNLVVDSGIYANSCSDHDAFDVFNAGSISAPKIEVRGGWETHGGSKVYRPTIAPGNICQFPPNKNPDWQISPTTPGYNPTRPGCPDVGQPELADPFATFPPAPALGPGNLGPPVSIKKVSRGLNGDGAGVARVVTVSAHGLAVGKTVTISGVGTFGGGSFDGTYPVASVPNATTFTFADPGSNVPVITGKRLSGGVATMTTNAPTTLTVGENDLSVSGILGFNIAGATVTGTGSTSFSYQPQPFTLSIGKKQLQSSRATLTLSTAGPTGLDPGDTVTVNIGDARFDGSRTVATVPSNTTFTYADSATTTLTVTKKAAAHGVATLTAANNLAAGDTVTVNIGDSLFDGTYTVAANSPTTPLSGTQFSYVDSNLGTMKINPTAKSMTGGVATITVANNLAIGESVTVQVGDPNYLGGPYTVSGIVGNPATGFKYIPNQPISLTTGSIANKIATVTTSVAHHLAAGDDVKVSGDEAYAFTAAASNVTVPTTTSFTYTPAPITGVSWTVPSATSATFTTPGTHDTKITSITVSGGGLPAYLNNKTFSGANLSVTGNTFTVKGTGFHVGDHNINATVTVVTAGAATFSGALATSETAWDLASSSVGNTVTVPYFLAATPTSGTVTAPALVAATAVSPAGSATVTAVPLLSASGLFTPAWMPTFGVLAQDLPGSAGIPSQDVISTGSVTLQPGTYYGGICIGVAVGSNCVNTTTSCKAAGGTTTTIDPYSPRIDLAVDVPDNSDATGGNTTIHVTASGISQGDLISIDDEEMTVTGVNGLAIDVSREANGTEDGAHSAGTQIFQVVTRRNATPYAPAKTLSVAINTSNPITFAVNSSTGIHINDVIEINSEAMTVTNVAGNNLTVTRGAFSTTIASHAKGAAVLQVIDSTAPPPPSVTLTKGVYIMAGGGFAVCGAANVNAPDGVLIYNTQDPPPNNSGLGALAQIDINTSGNVHLGPMRDGVYEGMTIFQDRSQTLVPGKDCNGKSTTPSQWDIALQSAAPLPQSGELGSVTGGIYAPHLRADFGDSMSGTSNLMIITSCIYINGASAHFTHDTSIGPLPGATATLGG